MMRLTTFASGSSGNCALLSMDGVHILLDAGISCRRICEHLRLTGINCEDLAAILITHEHSDHIAGLATLAKRCAAPICAPRAVAGYLDRTIAGVSLRLRVTAPEEHLRFGAVTVRCFRTSHDSAESVGWRADGPSGSFALATDSGCVTPEMREGLRGARCVLIEANHDVDMLLSGPYPPYLKRRILSERGHLSNDDCAALAADLAREGTRQILLGHLSRENNSPARALQTVSAALSDSGAAVYVAPADGRITLEDG